MRVDCDSALISWLISQENVVVVVVVVVTAAVACNYVRYLSNYSDL